MRSLGTATYGSGADSRQLGFFGGLASAGDRIVVASDHAQSLDARTGRTIWQAAPLSPPGGDDYFWAPPVIVGSIVLLGSGSGSEDEATRGRLSAYSLYSGAMLWTTPMVPVGGNGGGIVGQPSVDLWRRRVYVGHGRHLRRSSPGAIRGPTRWSSYVWTTARSPGVTRFTSAINSGSI